MYDYLVSAFGLTVLCLPFILLVTFVVPPFFLRLSRPKDKKGEPRKRNFIAATLTYAWFYLASLVVLSMLTLVFWVGFQVIFGANNAVDFAAQSLPVEREAVEEAAEPALTVEAER